MSALWPDTQPAIKRLQLERLRQMPAWREIALMAKMTESVRTPVVARLRQPYPTDRPDQRCHRLADLLPGARLAARAYDPSPEEGLCCPHRLA